MQNTSRIRIRALIYAVAIGFSPAYAIAASQTCAIESPETLSVSKDGTKAGIYCYAQHALELRYDQKKRTVTIVKNGRKTSVKKIDKGYTPELIGMTEYIRFLPTELQAYENQGVILFNTVERSTGGDGRGQCGSGYELYLNAANVSHVSVRLLGRVNIGSCLESTTLLAMAEGAADFSSFSVTGGKLNLKFRALKGQIERQTAVLSDDFRSLNVASKAAPKLD